MTLGLSATRLRAQEGIYYQRGVRPPGFYSLLLLDKPRRSTDDDVRDLLARLWSLYSSLKLGKVPDLDGAVVPGGNLKVLIGFGPRTIARSHRPGLSVLDEHGWTNSQFSVPWDA